MNRIVEKRLLAPGIILFKIEAPRIASRCKAGQFAMVRPAAHCERIPLTIADADRNRGSVTFVVQVVGCTTQILGYLKQGDRIADILGPLGEPTKAEQVGHVLCVGGGIGVAAMLPVARAMRAAGNRVTALCGARSRSHVILRDEVLSSVDEASWATDDGSYGFAGTVVERMEDWRHSQALPPALVHVVGPVAMMRAAAEVTRGWPAKTIASLNPIMIDGIGMCGGCRVTVGGVARFACIEGPEFDAHRVDFDDLARRNRAYLFQEHQAVSCRSVQP